MVKDIEKDVMFLAQKSEEAAKEDLYIAADLKDTLAAHRDGCVGMAANMIGYRKRIIIVSLGFADVVMINPVIKKKQQPYQTQEGCLSLDGVRPTIRYGKIRVEFYNEAFEKQTMDYEGHIAQIIQHECDHLDGIII